MSTLPPTMRAAGLGLGTLALAGLLVAAALFAQRSLPRNLAPANAIGDDDGMAMGDVPHLPPDAARRG